MKDVCYQYPVIGFQISSGERLFLVVIKDVCIFGIKALLT